MNLYLRVLIVLIRSFFKPCVDILKPVRLRLHVLPNDLDTNMHMNNGRYLTIMDLGRFDFVLRTGLMRLMFKAKSVPILAAAIIRYRLPLMPFQSYDLETRLVTWDEKWAYLEQRFLYVDGPKAGAVAALAVVKGSFYDSQSKKTVPTADLMRLLNHAEPSPEMPAYIKEWLKADEAMRAVTSQAD